ncbi:MAG: hypothetical protein GY806_12835 [Gammaproteobacteria bacterium]|nr:hypothetical protein [Gammaproteobacteria bacterium]
MAHTLFLVHGIGEHGQNWAEDIKTQLRETFAAIPSEVGQSLDDFVTFKPVNYDQIFESALERMRENNEKVFKAVTALDLTDTFFGKFSDFAGKLDDKSFFTTHALDVFFYRYTPMRGYIQALLAAEFLDVLMPTQIQNIDWSIISHSMGTSVVHDTLHNMFTTTFEDSDGNSIQLNPSNQFVKLYTALANVSRLLEIKRARAYRSVVRPRQAKPAPQGGGIIQNFINARHRFDPIALIREFNPEDRWYDRHATPGFRDVELTAVYETNVHGFQHYLANPKVYYPLLKMLTNSMADFDEFDRLVAEHQAGSLQGKFREARELYKDLNTRDFVQPILAGNSPFDGLKQQLGDIGDDIDEMIGKTDGDDDE